MMAAGRTSVPLREKSARFQSTRHATGSSWSRFATKLTKVSWCETTAAKASQRWKKHDVRSRDLYHRRVCEFFMHLHNLYDESCITILLISRMRGMREHSTHLLLRDSIAPPLLFPGAHLSPDR